MECAVKFGRVNFGMVNFGTVNFGRAKFDMVMASSPLLASLSGSVILLVKYKSTVLYSCIRLVVIVGLEMELLRFLVWPTETEIGANAGFQYR